MVLSSNRRAAIPNAGLSGCGQAEYYSAGISAARPTRALRRWKWLRSARSLPRRWAAWKPVIVCICAWSASPHQITRSATSPIPARAASMRSAPRSSRRGRYYRNFAQLWLAHQDEQAVPNFLKSVFFASTEHQLLDSREMELQRLLHRAEKLEDVLASVLHPGRMSRLQMYRSLVLAVNGTHYPAPLPPAGAPLHQYLAQQDLIGWT